ncbi:MAG: hypothetical protein ACK4XJ_08595 [Fimbriimonadaceae bacterium]
MSETQGHAWAAGPGGQVTDEQGRALTLADMIDGHFTAYSTNDPRGEVGQIACDDAYLYIKTTRGWKRIHLETF